MTCGEGRHILYCNNSATIALLSSIGEKGFQEKIILNRIKLRASLSPKLNVTAVL